MVPFAGCCYLEGEKVNCMERLQIDGGKLVSSASESEFWVLGCVCVCVACAFVCVHLHVCVNVLCKMLLSLRGAMCVHFHGYFELRAQTLSD